MSLGQFPKGIRSSHRNMSARPLDNYIRTFRRKNALSQEELAFLAGIGSGVSVCRFEQGKREPDLETALAFSVVFGAELSELFAGVFLKVEEEVSQRARTLAERIEGSGDPSKTRKLAALKALYEKGIN